MCRGYCENGLLARPLKATFRALSVSIRLDLDWPFIWSYWNITSIEEHLKDSEFGFYNCNSQEWPTTGASTIRKCRSATFSKIVSSHQKHQSNVCFEHSKRKYYHVLRFHITKAMFTLCILYIHHVESNAGVHAKFPNDV